MHEQDAEARRQQAMSPLGDWAVDTPQVPDGPRCPWCSGPLPDAAAERCDACGAQLAGAPDTPIPGVTTVASRAAGPSVPKSASPPRRSVLAWITGDEELVEAVGTPAPPAAGWVDAPAPGGTFPDPDVAAPGDVLPALDVTQLGPPSADALAPPDARLRREMLRVQQEAHGIVASEPAPEIVDDAAPTTADAGPPTAADGEAAASDVDRGPGDVDRDPGGADTPDAT